MIAALIAGYALFVAAVVWKTVVGLRLPKDFPPGPYAPLPILRWMPGSRFYKMSYPEIFKRLSVEYGGRPFSAHLGHKRVVLLSDIESVRTVYAKDFTQRPDEVVSEWRENKFGIIFSNDKDWQEQRKMFVSSLAKTGFKRQRLQKSLNALWSKMKAAVNAKICLGATAEISPEDFNLSLMEFVFSMVCDQSVVTNERAAAETADETIKNIDCDRTLGIQWCESKLWYRFGFLRSLAPNLTGYQEAKTKLDAAMNSLSNIVKTHHKTLSARAGESQDFIDLYLERIESSGEADASWGGATGMKRLMGALDTIPLGGDGLFVALNAAIFCLAKYPEKQRLLRSAVLNSVDIDVNVADEGGENEEGYRGGENAAYCRAFIMEVLRYVGQGAFGAVRQAKEDIWTRGYKIPKGVDVYPNAWYIMNDETHWNEPRKFKPERFLNAEGSVVNNPRWTPFGVGARACPAQNFSMEALQAIVARIVSEHHIDFGKYTADRKIGEEEETEMVGMGLCKPRDYVVKVRKISNGGGGGGGGGRSNVGARPSLLENSFGARQSSTARLPTIPDDGFNGFPAEEEDDEEDFSVEHKLAYLPRPVAVMG